MERHFHDELNQVKQKTLRLGSLVEDHGRSAPSRPWSIATRDLAEETIAFDDKVDHLEVEIDEDCLRLLALHQPAAGDLRFITTAMKIITDLERMADQAVNISQRAIELNEEPQLKPYIDIPIMSQLSQKMLRDSLDAFVRKDVEMARAGHRGRQQGGRPQESGVPGAPHLHDGGHRAPSRAPSDSSWSPATSSGSPTMPPTSPRWSCSWSRARTSATPPSRVPRSAMIL